ncbi:hypothetical protein [Sulfitobacter aestuariivivens]
MQEAREEEDAAARGAEPGPDGRIDVALASSHMFHDEPFASIDDVERERQITDLLARYREAVSTSLGDAGLPLGVYLGVSVDRLFDHDVIDALSAAGMDPMTWVWKTPDTIYWLGHWREGPELPVDVEFGRAPHAVFGAVKAQVAALG